MTPHLLLSENGSTRATAYAMSNKIVTLDRRRHVAWLDHVADIQVRTLNLETGNWGPTVLAGKGVDNHSGPAMVADGDGFLHLVFGPHHGPFAYRKSTRPDDVAEWSETEYFSENATYPSLVCHRDGTLFLTCRVSHDTGPWHLRFHHRPAGGTWSSGTAILDVAVPDYVWIGNSLAIDSLGRLHLAFCIYDLHPAGGKRFGYLISEDRGEHWAPRPGANPLSLPVTPDAPCWIAADPGLDVRVAGTVVDPENNPWFVVNHLEKTPRTVTLCTLENDQWHEIDLLPHLHKIFPDRELVDASIAFDNQGTLFVAATMGPPTTGNAYWGNPEQEVVALISRDRGHSFLVEAISTPDPSRPSWLPNLERSANGILPSAPLGLIYTSGGPGEGCLGGPATTVLCDELS